MEETVSVDGKGRLVLPKSIRIEAEIEVNHDLVAKAIGPGIVELFDPDILMARAQDIGARKLASWKESDHEASAYVQKSVKAK